MQRKVKELTVIGWPLWMAIAITVLVTVCAAGDGDPRPHEDMNHGGPITACHCSEG